MIWKGRPQDLVVPIYLFLCIMLGGSSRAVWGTLVLELAALPLIVVAALRPTRELCRSGRILLWLVLTGLVLIALQLVPMPPAIWSSLPGREVAVTGFRLLGRELPWLPISESPTETVSSALSLLPPIAIVVAVLRLDVCRDLWAIIAIVVATACSILLGYFQVSGNSSDWYIYEVTNVGAAVGFFANRNHMGTLLVMVIPFVAALLAGGSAIDLRETFPKWLAGAAAAVIILLGVAMNGSLAAVVLSLPVLAASALLFERVKRFRQIGFVIVAFASIVAVALLMSSPVQGKLSGTETSSIEGRQEIWKTTIHAAQAAFPVGTGFGSFERVYRTFEDPLTVGARYVNHAHNEYLELLLEGGLLALGILLTFLFWWAGRVGEAWRMPQALFGRAAAIASAAALCHSVVDYPLRTSAIAATFAFCIALLARGGGALTYRSSPSDLRPTRHVIITSDGRIKTL